MWKIALKLLIGDKAKFLGLIFGIFLATFLMTQQIGIFLGLVNRSYRMITDAPTVDVWVMDPGTEHMDKIFEMSDSKIEVVQAVPGVLAAAPMAFEFTPIKLQNGLFHVAHLVAVDEKTLIGVPQHMVQGSAENIRIPGGVIIDGHAIDESLAYTQEGKPLQKIKLGDSLEVFDHHAILVGIAEVTLGFYPQPIVYMGYQQYEKWTPDKPNHLAFIAVRIKEGENPDAVAKKITEMTGLHAYSTFVFRWRSTLYFLGTGILVNFGATIISGFLLGIAIVGTLFYLMILDNLPYFAMIRALGGKRKLIKRMIHFQALLIGIIGFGLGIGATAVVGGLFVLSHGVLSFIFPPILFIGTAFIIFLICYFTASIGIKKVLDEDPKLIMMK